MSASSAEDQTGAAVPPLAALAAGLQIVLQPIIEISTGTLFAYEALARFPGWNTEDVFAEAHATGFGFSLEAACLSAALDRLATMPDGVLMTVNLSPDAVSHPEIAPIWNRDLHGLVVEVTEQATDTPDSVLPSLERLRRQGAAIAIDDVGSGYAGLLRLAAVQPNLVKIDRRIVTGIAHSLAQRAVLEALVTFSHRLGAAVVGEGVETFEDLVTLAEYDVDYGQGQALGNPNPRPTPVSDDVVATCMDARARVLQRRSAAGLAVTDTLGMLTITSALSNATTFADIQAAAIRAAGEIGIDLISVSLLGVDGALREISSTSRALDPSEYPLRDYPATASAMRSGAVVEAHLADAHCDPAERRLLETFGYASLLLVPISVRGHGVGILELAHRTHRRWTTSDIVRGRGLASHIGGALDRIRS